ncbi:spore coat protein CotJB [Desulfuribacillus alkaliarsenatis]|uniref:Protein CotJB domain-containing protein n=1 Tax=Desulfuribacillus alkaliarsenatis TaxID=766136 RepID=A0A1E5FZW5_9FIRM|nr:spore coat protein CotJB [Desulfuribacillus alkaliarsenatis]OEF96112.1 hypothetical protein BHF68_10295 [Desulfuribacillus alkaliarsenatis]
MSKATTESCKKMPREQMLKEIQALEFALLEINLYLDMYPTDKRAVCQYNVLSEQMNILKTEYQMEYGSLYNYGEFPSKYPFDWVKTPWPWEL